MKPRIETNAKEKAVIPQWRSGIQSDIFINHITGIKPSTYSQAEGNSKVVEHSKYRVDIYYTGPH